MILSNPVAIESAMMPRHVRIPKSPAIGTHWTLLVRQDNQGLRLTNDREQATRNGSASNKQKNDDPQQGAGVLGGSHREEVQAFGRHGGRPVVMVLALDGVVVNVAVVVCVSKKRGQLGASGSAK